MGHYRREIGLKGSQKHIQQLVNGSDNRLNDQIRKSIGFAPDEEIIWKSPIKAENFVEYKDQKFLDVLTLKTATERRLLTDFWPRSGPRWDALAQTNKQQIILVEAKSHASEVQSTCMAKDPAAKEKIQKALNETKAHFGCQTQNDWSIGYYQYANRLAHLYWLRELNNVNAHLVFIYFVNDSEMNGPKSEAEWKPEIAKVHAHLGLNAMPDCVHDIFIDVSREQRVLK